MADITVCRTLRGKVNVVATSRKGKQWIMLNILVLDPESYTLSSEFVEEMELLWKKEGLEVEIL